uniref:Uncharacterized protein n=1 Tax=Heterorhabditis bacteriophora TaxID=37862 RepID=A0A1I7WFE6_HETBA
MELHPKSKSSSNSGAQNDRASNESIHFQFWAPQNGELSGQSCKSTERTGIRRSVVEDYSNHALRNA